MRFRDQLESSGRNKFINKPHTKTTFMRDIDQNMVCLIILPQSKKIELVKTNNFLY